VIRVIAQSDKPNERQLIPFIERVLAKLRRRVERMAPDDFEQLVQVVLGSVAPAQDGFSRSKQLWARLDNGIDETELQTIQRAAELLNGREIKLALDQFVDAVALGVLNVSG
jgi:hypothetical protein